MKGAVEDTEDDVFEYRMAELRDGRLLKVNVAGWLSGKLRNKDECREIFVYEITAHMIQIMKEYNIWHE